MNLNVEDGLRAYGLTPQNAEAMNYFLNELLGFLEGDNLHITLSKKSKDIHLVYKLFLKFPSEINDILINLLTYFICIQLNLIILILYGFIFMLGNCLVTSSAASIATSFGPCL